MDGSFFALGLIGALLGYIVGDFQRERRYRRESRANLARSNDRYADAHADTVRGPDFVCGPVVPGVSGTDFVRSGLYDDGTANRDAGRRAIPRADFRPRVGRYAARGSVSFPDAAPVMASRRGLDYDCA